MNDEIRQTDARLNELVAEHGRICSRGIAAAKTLDAAEADVRKHADAFEAANLAYADEPTDDNAVAISKARDALHLATLRLNKPRAHHAAIEAESAAHRTALAAAERACRDARLRERASLETYQARTADPFKTLLAALAAIPRAAAEIDQAFDDAKAAALELGEPPLGPFHRIAPLLRSAVQVYGARGLVTQHGFYKAAEGCPHGLLQALPLPLLDAIKFRARNVGILSEEVAAPLLERVLACRTAGEGDELIKQAEQAEPSVTESARPAPPPRVRPQRSTSEEHAADDVTEPPDGVLGNAAEFKRVASEGLAILASP